MRWTFLCLLGFGLFQGRAFALTQGPLSPGTAVIDISTGTVAWTNVANSTTSNNVYATAPEGVGNKVTQFIKSTNFGFTIPNGATIDGITVEWEFNATNANGFAADDGIRIVKGGTIGTTNKARLRSILWPTADTFVSYGSASDLWGNTWTCTDINDATFGAVLSAATGGNAGTASVDSVRITINYTGGSGVCGATTTTNARRRLILTE